MYILIFSVVLGMFIYSKARPLSLCASHVLTNWFKDTTILDIDKTMPFWSCCGAVAKTP